MTILYDIVSPNTFLHNECLQHYGVVTYIKGEMRKGGGPDTVMPILSRYC